jgi:hypothetical protein
MQQKELASLLGVSPAIVSRHAKRGMPTDTLERAQKWRKRHLEPGRVKGNRYENKHDSEPTPRPAVLLSALDVEMEAAGDLIDEALACGNQYGAAIRTCRLRNLLRQATNDASPRLTVRTWVALLDYFLHPAADIRRTHNMGKLVTPCEFGSLVSPDAPWPAHVVLFDARDFDDDAINGYPEYPGDPDWVAAMAEDRLENAKLPCSSVFGCQGYPMPDQRISMTGGRS